MATEPKSDAGAQQRQQEVSIWDPQDPASLVSIVPPEVARRFREAREAAPELFELDEQELARELRRRNQTPTATDNRLRLKFWLAYDEAKERAADAQINIKSVTANVCSREFFYAHYLARPGKVAWLVCPPTSYTTKITEALEFGLEQMREILSFDHYEYAETTGADGTKRKEIVGINTKVASLKVTVFKMLDDRKHGLAVQKVEARAAVLHAAIPAGEKRLLLEAAQSETEEDLLKRLEEAKRREMKAMHVSEKDVTPTKEDQS